MATLQKNVSDTALEHSVGNKVKTVYFVALATLMHYFINEFLNLGIFVTYRHVFALLLVASALCLFLFCPNYARGAVTFKSALVYSLPLLVTIVASLFVWFQTRADADIIARGLSGAFVYTNMLSFALGGGALLYVFGEKGIWYHLISILLANLLIIVQIIAENGVGPYFSELTTLVMTFAAETGEIIVQAEVHELAFCLGAYLIYMGLKPRKSPVFFLLLAGVLFCFVSAFKRIGIFAIVIALCFGLILRFLYRFHAPTGKVVLNLMTALILFALVLYVAAIKMGAFELLEKIGVETSGRDDIYRAVDKFYTFSPEYQGGGIGFLTYQLSTNLGVGVSSVHNDFLQYYIDLGFFGYLFWLFAMTFTRIWYFGRKGNFEGAVISFSLLVYLIVVSSTDNTMNYPLLTGTLAILMMSLSYDDRVRSEEEKIFGSLSPENRDAGKGGLL